LYSANLSCILIKILFEELKVIIRYKNTLVLYNCQFDLEREKKLIKINKFYSYGKSIVVQTTKLASK
jgi:hypothetical protein